MFPLVAIGGVIGAVYSIAKGASWVADQLGGPSSSSAASAGGKSADKPATAALSSEFEAALAAQVAGQKAPAGASPPATVAALHGPDQDVLARMKAGTVAYSHIGEHRDQNAKPADASEDQPVTRS
jgi:hypothetical protein